MFHSNVSPFNQRQPKAGPPSLPTKAYEPSAKSSMDSLLKKYSSATHKSDLPPSRPVVTNSRVKKDEKYRRDMYLAFINNALLQKSKGTTGPFNELVAQFSFLEMAKDDSTAVATSQLRLWLSALSHVVSQLEQTHSALVNAIISMPWTTMDTTFVQSYISFVGMLVSARPEYLGLVLEKAARGLIFRSGLQASEISVSSEEFVTPLTRRMVYDRLHCLLEHLLSLVPTLPSTLQPLLVRNFPHKRQDRADQETYIRNLLRITEYCPALTDRILTTIIDRAIQIDVEIQVEMEDIEAEEAGPSSGDIFTLDPFDTIVGQEGNDSDEDSDGDDLSDLSSDFGGDLEDTDTPSARQDISQVRDMIAKLDGILKLLFDYFHRGNNGLSTTIRSPIGSSNSLDDGTTSPIFPLSTPSIPFQKGHEFRRNQFITLLSIFDRTILRTFRSRYTQFLVFWYSSLDPEFTDMFQGLLVSKALLEETQPVVTRAAAASYIASFVSRARFVDKANARLTVGLLCDFLQAHLDMCAALGDNLDPTSPHHTIFYAVSQAIFLIFCFRWRDLHLDEESELADVTIEPTAQKKWLAKLDVIQRVITSELNPLKVCSRNVVNQFARVAQRTDFVYCYTIIENNKRSSPRSSGNIPLTKTSASRIPHSALGRESLDADLNSFFPFDPYKLPLSHSHIKNLYREWSSVALEEDEEEEEEEAGEEAEEAERGTTEQGNASLLLTTSQPWPIDNTADDGTAALGTSFGGMSISPVRTLLPLYKPHSSSQGTL